MTNKTEADIRARHEADAKALALGDISPFIRQWQDDRGTLLTLLDAANKRIGELEGANNLYENQCAEIRSRRQEL